MRHAGRALLGRLALADRADEVIGDLEEVHRARVDRHGRSLAALLTTMEALDMTVALLRERRDRRSLARLRHSTRAATLPTVSWLDFKLGLRMFGRYPSLTTVAVLAMAFGIATGAGTFQLVRELVLLPLPYADEDRIVRIENVSTETTHPEPRALHDFAAWREQLRSVERVSALHLRGRTLSTGEAVATPVAEAAVSATAFTLVDARPILGRTLLPADEEPGAPTVVVLGYELWRNDFAADPDVVGRVVRLGAEATTVVGVMPESFAFFLPQREGFGSAAPQELWVPFRLRPLDYARGEGPPIAVFGRLAPDATADDARAELARRAVSSAAQWPETHARLTPRLLGFDTFGGGDGLVATGALALSALFLGLLMVVVCGNVALLLFARAATREGEIAVRSALGASRGRIVSQLFAEALVIAGVAVVVGLMGASAGLRWAMGVIASLWDASGQAIPSWMDDSLSAPTIAYAMALAILGAVVAGVLPALKLTGRRAQVNLQRPHPSAAGDRLARIACARRSFGSTTRRPR